MVRWWAGLLVGLILATSLGGAAQDNALAQVGTDTTAVPPGAYLTEFAVKDTTAPRRDPYAVFTRLKGGPSDPPRTTTKRTYQVADQDTFSVADLELKTINKVTATAVAVTPHLYMFMDNRLLTSQNRNDFVNFANQFETKIYPTTRKFFGPEDSPGVDNDPHLVVLNTPLKIAAGYFSSDDLQLNSINPSSNEREMFFIDPAKNFGDGYLATLAHEFQHMINNHSLPDQDIWLNEGSSVLSQVLNGYSSNGLEGSYMTKPASQLNAWTCGSCGTAAYYGGGYTWLSFLEDRFGFDTVRSIPQNGKGLTGFNAVDLALYANGQSDQTSESVLKNFALANYLNRRTADPLYNYSKIGTHVDRVSTLSTSNGQEDLNQYGSNYYTVTGNDKGINLSFQGAPTVRLAGPGPHSGQQAWWSNRADSSDMTLTRSVDLGSVKNATLKFWTWFDIEPSYDWLYVEVSPDNGQTWEVIKGNKYTTTRDPSGKAFGPGMTGQSIASGIDPADTIEVRATWVQDSFDLSKFAGKQIKLRLEYLTDEGYSRNGALFDDFEIPEIGWKDDVESGENGWEAAGFVRSNVTLPQHFWVQVISREAACADTKTTDLSKPTSGVANGQSCIQTMNLDASNSGQQTFPFKQAIVVVTPYASRTLTPAKYTLKLAS